MNDGKLSDHQGEMVADMRVEDKGRILSPVFDSFDLNMIFSFLLYPLETEKEEREKALECLNLLEFETIRPFLSQEIQEGRLPKHILSYIRAYARLPDEQWVREFPTSVIIETMQERWEEKKPELYRIFYLTIQLLKQEKINEISLKKALKEIQPLRQNIHDTKLKVNKNAATKEFNFYRPFLPWIMTFLTYQFYDHLQNGHLQNQGVTLFFNENLNNIHELISYWQDILMPLHNKHSSPPYYIVDIEKYKKLPYQAGESSLSSEMRYAFEKDIQHLLVMFVKGAMKEKPAEKSSEDKNGRFVFPSYVLQRFLL